MIVVRNVFRLRFGMAREAVALMKEGRVIDKRAMSRCDRPVLHAGPGNNRSTEILS